MLYCVEPVNHVSDDPIISTEDDSVFVRPSLPPQAMWTVRLHVRRGPALAASQVILQIRTSFGRSMPPMKTEILGMARHS